MCVCVSVCLSVRVVRSFVRWLDPLRSVVGVLSSSSVVVAVVARSLISIFFWFSPFVTGHTQRPCSSLLLSSPLVLFLVSFYFFSLRRLAERPVDSLRLLRFCFCSVSCSCADLLYLHYVALTLFVPHPHIVDHRHPEGITSRRDCAVHALSLSLCLCLSHFKLVSAVILYTLSPPTPPPV